MDNELNMEKAQAVTAFLSAKPERYLAMVYNVEKRLKFYLGEEKVSTALAKEVMSEVIFDVIDGKRKWDMNKFSAEQVLWYNIPSEVSALVKKELRYVPVNGRIEDVDDDNSNSIENLASTPAEDIEGNIDAGNLEKYCLEIILKDDVDAQIVFLEMLQGKYQAEIADYTHYKVEDVEKIIRSIRRKISKKIPYHMIENIPFKLKDKILNQT